MINNKMKDIVKDGDIVIIHNTNWDYTKRIGEPFKAIVIWCGINGQPLLVKCEDIKKGIYKPFWSSYSSITEIKGNVDLAKLIESEESE
jgi:hypothetical protein